MTCVLHIVLFGAVQLAPQDLPSLILDLGYAGARGFAFRLADVDGNGQQDLILPTGVYFQHNGGFSSAMTAPSPASDLPAQCDVWNNTLFLKLPDRLQIVRWEGKGWRSQIDQPLEWPNPGNEEIVPVYAAAGGLKFGRFLHDIDRDGIPEIVFPDDRGLRIYREAAGVYAETSRLDVFPPLRLARLEEQRLWPDSERSVAFPAREMTCRYNLDANHLAVVTREDCPTMTLGLLARYRIARYAIDAAASFQIVDAETRHDATEPFPPYLELMRLNDDAVADIAGGDWRFSQSSPIRAPIYETRASTDGGKSFKTVRVRGFRPNQSFIDVDQDGRVDLVTESTNLFDGGMRESVSRFCTSRDIRHEIHVYLQKADATFPEKADIQGAFTIQLEAPPLRNGAMFTRYQAGELFNLTGDFNGDGHNDLLLQDRPDRLSLHLAAAGGFDKTACARVAVGHVHRTEVADFNGDGRADAAVHGYDAQEDSSALKTRLYITREDGA